MNNYVEKNLMNDEEIIAVAKRTPLLLTAKTIKAVLWTVFWVVLGIVAHPLIFIFALIPVVNLACNFISFYRNRLTLTNDRVIFRKGVFNTMSIDFPYEQIETVQVEQPFLGKIFHYSEVKVSTGGDGARLDGIIEGDKLKNIIVTQSDAKKKQLAQEQAEATARAMREAMLAVSQENAKQQDQA